LVEKRSAAILTAGKEACATSSMTLAEPKGLHFCARMVIINPHKNIFHPKTGPRIIMQI